MTALAQAQNLIARYRTDPVSMVVEQFGVQPDLWQIDALRAFASKDKMRLRIALLACAGPGKTALLAWIGWNFLLCYADKGLHPNGVAIAVTNDNLRDNLWKEFSVWHQRSKLLMGLFEWQKTRIFAKDHPTTWFLSARSWSKNANAEEQGRTLSGLHAGYILYLIDESGDIPPTVLRSAEQGLSTCIWGRIVQAGNPTSQGGMLYLAANAQRADWHVQSITGDPDDPKRSPRIDLEWARGEIAKYGRDNPWVMAYILGLFPPSSINALLGMEEVQLAMTRRYKEDVYSFSQKRLGIDAARFGADPWVLFPRQGLNAAWNPVAMRGPRSHDVAARIAVAHQNFKHERNFFDGTGGFAAGAIDSCLQAGLPTTEINFSGKAIDPRYYNKRSEMWFLMAEWVKRGGALPNVADLVGELTIPTYTFVKGKFLMEEKDQIRKRLGRSPNYADALALTFAEPDCPATLVMPHPAMQEEYGKMRVDYDPLENA